MDIFKFVAKLLPRIERSNVEQDLDTTEKECINILMPSWQAAVTYFKVNKPVSDAFNELSMRFYRSFNLRKAQRAPNFVADIERRLPILHDNIEALKAALDESVQKDIITEGMTMRTAFIIRASANLSLVTRFASSLLNYIYVAEASEMAAELNPGLELTKAEIRYVDREFDRFVRLFSEYTIPTKDFRELISNIPAVFVNDASKNSVIGLLGAKADPMEASGLAGFVGSPIYRIRLIFARWQNDRYESAKAKKQQLELRLLYLQMQKEKNVDPTIEREIEQLQNRIDRLDASLRETEESLKD